MNIPHPKNQHKDEKYLGNLDGEILYGIQTWEAYMLGGGKLVLFLMKELVETKFTLFIKKCFEGCNNCTAIIYFKTARHSRQSLRQHKWDSNTRYKDS
jgi:hypothetical protein